MPTVIGHGLVGPEDKHNCANTALEVSASASRGINPKGKAVNIPLLGSE